VDIDYRDQPLNPRSGGQYKLEWTSFDDRASKLFGFKRVDAEIRQYIPFFNLRRVIAFRAKTSLVDSKAGNRVPFFMQPTLGGSDDLRGFREFRFRDQNLFLMNLEYRWEAFSGLDMAIFGDAGKVFARRADLGFGDLETSVGSGARFNSANGVFFRLDTGFSHEGTRIFWKFGHVF
jgi:outer membrane protein assembly factor BamA